MCIQCENINNFILERKFLPESTLYKYLLLEKKCLKDSYNGTDIINILRQIIIDEKLYDILNPEIIICDDKLKTALNCKIFHISDLNNIVLIHFTDSGPIKCIHNTIMDNINLLSVCNWGTVIPKSIVLPNIYNKYTVNVKLQEIFRSLGTKAKLFTYLEIVGLIHKYLHSINYNNIIYDEPICRAFNVTAFHYSQLKNLIFNSITKIQPTKLKFTDDIQ